MILSNLPNSSNWIKVLHFEKKIVKLELWHFDWLLLSKLICHVFHFRKHIPHAQFFDIFKGATNTATHNRNIPPPEAFQEQARAVGINDDDHIIVYDSIPGKFGLFLGSRTWWMFRVSIKKYFFGLFLS